LNKVPMAAHVSLASERPTLVLEQMDHLIEEIHCEQGSMHIKFKPIVYADVRYALEAYDEFLAISSHHSCNSHGSRLPHM
jgi:hypothetical protein